MVHPYIHVMHVLRLYVFKKWAFSEKSNKQEKKHGFFFLPRFFVKSSQQLLHSCRVSCVVSSLTKNVNFKHFFFFQKDKRNFSNVATK